jgi:hypothetical protein
MVRTKADILAKLKEQMGFLRTSVHSFYEGNFAESIRIATSIRVLVHETGRSKPLLMQAMPSGLEVPILDHEPEKTEHEQIMGFTVGVRLGSTLALAVDLASFHYSLSSVGAWWNRTVFTFPAQFGNQPVYRRRQVILILANKEGGAHVDEHEDPDYRRLMTDSPLSFVVSGVRLETPDLAKFLAAQSGVKMLDCLKRNFLPDEEVPLKWEFGVAPPVAQYMDRISLTPGVIETIFPRAELNITRRN